MPTPNSVRSTRPTLCAAVAIRYRFVTSINPHSHVRRIPPVSHTWAKLADRGLAALTVACFALVVMGWYGVNFVLGAGLHSYGFGGGGQQVVYAAVVLQLLYVAVAVLRAPESNVDPLPSTAAGPRTLSSHSNGTSRGRWPATGATGFVRASQLDAKLTNALAEPVAPDGRLNKHVCHP